MATVSDTVGVESDTFSFSEETAKHYIKRDFRIEILGSDEDGALKYVMPMTPEIDSKAQELAKAYEKYAIKDGRILLNSSSPLGMASGALQACQIIDPENSNFADAGVENVVKAVRQANSKIMRPRDSIPMDLTFEGTRYCKAGKDPRLSSFGALAFVVRSRPEATDYAKFTLTYECTMVFYGPTVIDDGITTRGSWLLRDYNLKDGKLVCVVDEKLINGPVKVLFEPPLYLIVKTGNITRRRIARELYGYKDYDGNLTFKPRDQEFVRITNKDVIHAVIEYNARDHAAWRA